MADLIERSKAIDAINDLPDCPNGFSDTYDKTRIIGVLEEVPSAQPEPQWIPCSERLPEVDVDVLVSYHAFGDSESEYFPPYDGVMITCLTEVTNNGIPDFYDMTDDVQPTAWMPLPDPWRGEEHGKDTR